MWFLVNMGDGGGSVEVLLQLFWIRYVGIIVVSLASCGDDVCNRMYGVRHEDLVFSLYILIWAVT